MNQKADNENSLILTFVVLVFLIPEMIQFKEYTAVLTIISILTKVTALALGITYLFFNRKLLTISKKIQTQSTFLVLLLIFTLISCAWTISIFETAKALFVVLTWIVTLLLSKTFHIKTRNILRMLINFFITISFFSLCLSIVINGHSISDYTSSTYSIPTLISAPPLILVTGIAFNLQHLTKIVSFCIVIMSLILLFQFPSKSYFVGTIISVLAGLCFLRFKVVYSLALVVLMCFVLLWLLTFDNSLSRSFVYKPIVLNNIDLTMINTSGRLLIWSLLLEASSAHSFQGYLGIGAGASNELLALISTRDEISVHSEHIKNYLEYGLFSVIFYVTIILYLFKLKEIHSWKSDAYVYTATIILFYYLSVGITYLVSDSPFLIILIFCCVKNYTREFIVTK